MSEKKEIKEKIQEFIKDETKNKIEIWVPDNFKMSWVVSLIRYSYRKFILTVQKWIIPSKFKNWLLNRAGAKIGYDVCIPHYIHFDNYFPELITIEKGSLIGGLSMLVTHELKNGKLVLGRVHVKEKVLLAGLTTLNPGVTVNSYVITGMKSNITKDCPEKSFIVGKDKIIKQWDKKEIEKYFGDSKNKVDYYYEFKKKTKEFRKNKKIMVVNIPYNGKRMNAGDDWYLARPWVRIFYNAAFVELARIMPGNWLRIFLWRCMGAKIGENVCIGKNVVFDHIYGDKVEIGDDVYINDGAYLDGHSYTIAESVFGRVKIGDRTKLEKGVMVMCGVTIGKDCTIKENSSVMKDVPDGEVWGGVPAKYIGKEQKLEINKIVEDKAGSKEESKGDKSKEEEKFEKQVEKELGTEAEKTKKEENNEGKEEENEKEIKEEKKGKKEESKKTKKEEHKASVLRLDKDQLKKELSEKHEKSHKTEKIKNKHKGHSK